MPSTPEPGVRETSQEWSLNMPARSNEKNTGSKASEEQVNSDILPVLQSSQEIRSYYNKIARIYDLMAERSEEPMRRVGIEKLNVRPGERVLEIGYGTGHCLIEFAQRVRPGGRVYGVDISDEMFKLANDLVEKEGCQDVVELLRHDASNLPFEDESMDAVFMSFTLELFDTPKIPVVLGECRRILRPGGRVGVVSLSKESSEDPMVRVFEWTHRHFPNLLDCRPIFAARALEQAGLEIVDEELQHMWVPVEIVVARKVS